MKFLTFCWRLKTILEEKESVKNEARVIDLDLICYNDLIINTEKLILPHPRMHLRAFCYAPNL